MSDEQIDKNKIFEYKLRPIKVVDHPGKNIEIFAHGKIFGIDNEEFITLCQVNDLRVGLLIFKLDSHSEILAEFRAIQVIKGFDEGTFRAKFSIPRNLFDEQQCRLAKIDLLYEHKFWFEQKTGPRAFIPIWAEKPPIEADIFEYYQSKYINK